MKPIVKFASLGLAALVLAALPLGAADNSGAAGAGAKMESATPATGNSNRAIPFRGKLASKTDSSITVGARTFEITPETKLMKDGSAATLADAVVGEQVGGSYFQVDNKLVAKMVRFGAKPEVAGSGKKGKTEANEK